MTSLPLSHVRAVALEPAVHLADVILLAQPTRGSVSLVRLAQSRPTRADVILPEMISG